LASIFASFTCREESLDFRLFFCAPWHDRSVSVVIRVECCWCFIVSCTNTIRFRADCRIDGQWQYDCQISTFFRNHFILALSLGVWCCVLQMNSLFFDEVMEALSCQSLTETTSADGFIEFQIEINHL
jgi:hypothetical protein